jgi:hypothetical protein
MGLPPDAPTLEDDDYRALGRYVASPPDFTELPFTGATAKTIRRDQLRGPLADTVAADAETRAGTAD